MSEKISGGYISYDIKNKSWKWRATIDGRLYSITSKSREQLERRVCILQKGMLATPIGNGLQTFREFSEKWLQLIRPTVKVKTMDFYSQAIGNLLPLIGDKKIVEIKAADAQDVLNRLSLKRGVRGKTLSPSTVNGIRRTFRVCMRYAEDNGLIPFNPVRRTKPMTAAPKEIVALDRKGLARLLSTAYARCERAKSGEQEASYYKERCYSNLTTLAAATGARIGELAALEWRNVDFKRKEVKIAQNITESDNQGLIFQAPKTGKIRKISLDKETAEWLAAWREEQRLWEMEHEGAFSNQYDLVFTNILGAPVRYSTFRAKYWLPLCQEAGLKGLGFHSLRHTHATLLLLAGVPLKVVSDRLGHSSTQQTLDTYYNMLPNQQQEASRAYASMELPRPQKSQN